MDQEKLPNFTDAAKNIVLGSLYEHYRGLLYKILHIARHIETLEELIVYQALYGEGDVWVRPLSMFLEEVLIDGKLQPRFTRIAGKTASL